MKCHFKSILVFTFIILSSFLIKPVFADVVSNFYPYDQLLLPQDNNYLVMTIDKNGKVLSSHKTQIKSTRPRHWLTQRLEYANRIREASQQGFFQENNKWGYKNKQGKIIISPKFDSVDSFSEGLAAIYVDEKSGFIDKTGKMAIKPQFCGARNFKQDLAAVHLKYKNQSEYNNICYIWGFINKNGKIITKQGFDEVHDFSEGLAAVRIDEIGNSKWGFIDKSGKMIIEPQFKEVHDFSEGLAAIRVYNHEKGLSEWGFINKTGKMIITPQFDYTEKFSEGLAAVKVKTSKKWEYKWGFINKSGELVIKPQFYNANNFKNGKAEVWKKLLPTLPPLTKIILTGIFLILIYQIFRKRKQVKQA